ncbi:SulP family inorganic anion transporter [uncultured Maricaulis sp.]|uniref:SulP family inorganic anion transporter n=1 Tax=uncultured Maricaulis sp. TaxID=174710 RepID=UPI0030DCF08E|tara:strand:+ start:43755 stop:45491 length:1737 start_codon:yes stop_codon:yes gene_type:complete
MTQTNPKTKAKTPPPPPALGELFMPKLITVLREGYTLAHLRSDAIAGLTVAIVALPLSMAIAIAAGASPAQGIITAIIGGFFVSLLGGSRFQIGGPAGAFIVLMATTVQTYGMDGMILATMMAGAILMAIGFLKLGTYIKFIPYPVTVGFTAGIAVIIFASQIKELLGLDLAVHEPGPLLEKLPVLWNALPTTDPLTISVSAATVLVIIGVRHWRPHWPGMLIAVSLAAAATAAFTLPLETIGSRFGGIPSGLPWPSLPEISGARLLALLPSAIAFALLGSIESLLSAVVADGMTGRHHRSNSELVAQGVANIGAALFGGICVTGTIARTATNVRAGAHGPIAGIMHSGFLLLFILIAAPLASFIPLACLAGVLALVAWNMVEKHAFMILLRASRADALILLATFGLTIFRDLTEAIVVGFAIGSVVFIHRMSLTTAIESWTPFVDEDKPDRITAPADVKAGPTEQDSDILVYRISGAFFFGAAASIGSVLERIADTHRVLIIDFAAVPFVDSTAANMILGLAHQAQKRSLPVIISGASNVVQQRLIALEITTPLVSYEPTLAQAMTAARVWIDARDE